MYTEIMSYSVGQTNLKLIMKPRLMAILLPRPLQEAQAEGSLEFKASLIHTVPGQAELHR